MWRAVESDPGVFSELVESWGVRNIAFHESLGIDADSLRAVTGASAGIYGVIFLFKWTPGHRQAALNAGGQLSPDAPVFWAPQTVEDACATFALLSLILNIPGLDIGANLEQVREFAAALPPDVRGDAISSNEFLRNCHNHMTRTVVYEADPSYPQAKREDAFHYVGYVPVDNRLYELDGLQSAPIDHGPVGTDAVDAIAAALQRRVAQFPASELHFSVLVATPDIRTVYKDDPSMTTVVAEETERWERWHRENALRRQALMPLALEMLKQMAADNIL